MTAVDLNPVAHLIEKCVLEYPQRFGQPNELGENSLAEDFVKWADWVRKRVEPKLDEVFPSPTRTADGPQSTSGRVHCGAPTQPARQRSRCSLPSGWPTAPGVKYGSKSLGGPEKSTLISRKVGREDLTSLSDGTVKASSVTCPGCTTSMSRRKSEITRRKPASATSSTRCLISTAGAGHIGHQGPMRSTGQKDWPQRCSISSRKPRTEHQPCLTKR